MHLHIIFSLKIDIHDIDVYSQCIDFFLIKKSHGTINIVSKSNVKDSLFHENFTLHLDKPSDTHTLFTSNVNRDFYSNPDSNYIELFPEQDCEFSFLSNYTSTCTCKVYFLQFSSDRFLKQDIYSISNGANKFIISSELYASKLCVILAVEGKGVLSLSKLRLKRIPMTHQSILFYDITEVKNIDGRIFSDVVVIMPCLNINQGKETARILLRRSKVQCTILIIYDSIKLGFVTVVNQTAEYLHSKYIVYLAQDAWPSRGWLKCALDTLEESGKGLLAFNDGKWDGRIAAFGMVRKEWISKIYGGNIFYNGYHSHAADNEITIIARAQNEFVYNPNCVLMEYDHSKDHRGGNPKDKKILERRFLDGFDKIVPVSKLKSLAFEYKITSFKTDDFKNLTIYICFEQDSSSLHDLIYKIENIITSVKLEIVILIQSEQKIDKSLKKKFSTIDISIFSIPGPYNAYDYLAYMSLLAKYKNILAVNNCSCFDEKVFTNFFESIGFKFNHLQQVAWSPCNKNENDADVDFMKINNSKSLIPLLDNFSFLMFHKDFIKQ